MTVRIQVTERLISECAQVASTLRTVGSFVGAAGVVSVIAVLLATWLLALLRSC